MPNHAQSFLFDAAGTAPVSFQTVSQPNTIVLMLGVVGLMLVAWFGRKDSRVWLAPLTLFAFLVIVETEHYLDSSQRFDKISVNSRGVHVASFADSGSSRYFSFEEISRIESAPSGRFGEACRVKIALKSGGAIYSVNFFEPCGSAAPAGDTIRSPKSA